MKKGDKCQIHLEKGKFYFSSKKYRAAIDEFKEALRLETDNPEILYSLAVAYETNSDYILARETYQKVLALKPDHSLALKHLEDILGR